ncbi:hypothetical protein QCA50_002458 [Cerrena zonata]|uniref:Homeobox domain-containing protein n=1 Tax=Cerrena zonata TaxID=2478898 RepID=A0AAW0GWX9_9APHY
MHEDSANLRNQLSAVQDLFISSLLHDDRSLVAFDQHWNTLVAWVTRGVQEGWLEQDVAQLAYNSATLIATYVDSLHICAETVEAMVFDVKDALARLTLSDAVAVVPSSKSISEKHVHADGERICPPSYIPAAYQWLMENIHNPYPTSHVKHDLASRSGLSTRQVHDWFKAARRSIGWVDFSRKHFQGSRSLAVEAAAQVLLEQGTSRQIPLEIEVDILSLKGTAECLYSAVGVSYSDNTRWSPFLPIPSNKGSSAGRIQTSSSPNTSLSALHAASALRTHESSHNTNNSRAFSLPSIRSHPRKRRLSDADTEEIRKKPRLLPGGPRRQAVSDPLPRTSEPGGLNMFWRDMFTPTVSSLLPDEADPGPISIIPIDPDTPASDEQIASLSSFYASLIPENGPTSTSPVVTPETMAPQSNIPLPPPAPVYPQTFNEILPFADLTLAMEPVDVSATNESLAQFLSSLTPENDLFDFSTCLSDNSSDTSSILTLSPPRTPTITPTSNLEPSDSTQCLNLPNIDPTSAMNFSFPTHQPEETFSILDEILRDKTTGKNSAAYSFPLTEVDPALGTIRFDPSYPIFPTLLTL